MKRLILLLFLLALISVVIAGALLNAFAHRPLETRPSHPLPFEFTVEKGATWKGLSKKLVDEGLESDARMLWLLGRITGQAGSIQAGNYRLDPGSTPLTLLQKLADGDVIPMSITFVEGITFADMRAQLEQSPGIKVTLKGLPVADVLARVGAVEKFPEGLFFPDTYRYAAGTTDLDLLRKSYQTQQRKLAEAWNTRAPNLPYRSPYEALIMASIIEKETGRVEDRQMIASVFVNRLKLPMRLQTDPTVIYGLGARFDGNLRKVDLVTDTPYNTYTRDGLPPTPISLPGNASLRAALQPAQSDKLYFVSKGDGSSYFSKTLEEHNRAVAKYQLHR